MLEFASEGATFLLQQSVQQGRSMGQTARAGTATAHQ